MSGRKSAVFAKKSAVPFAGEVLAQPIEIAYLSWPHFARESPENAKSAVFSAVTSGFGRQSADTVGDVTASLN
jgi:hypothetical protein